MRVRRTTRATRAATEAAKEESPPRGDDDGVRAREAIREAMT